MGKIGLDKLNDMQRAFVNEYLIDKNATQAYMRAGYKATGKAAEVNASKLLGNAKVRSVIDKRMAMIADRLEITPEKILQEIAAVAFAKVDDYVKVVEHTGINYDVHGKEKLKPDGSPDTYLYQVLEVKNSDELTEFQKKAVKSIKQGKYGLELQFHDKIKAAELLGRNHKLFVDKTELTGANGEQLQVVFNIPRPPKKNTKEV